MMVVRFQRGRLVGLLPNGSSMQGSSIKKLNTASARLQKVVVGDHSFLFRIGKQMSPASVTLACIILQNDRLVEVQNRSAYGVKNFIVGGPKLKYYHVS